LPIPPENEADNDRLIGLIRELEDRDNPTPEEKMIAELLTIVVQNFEEKHYHVPTLPTHELLHEVMEQRGMAHKDLAILVGNKGLTSEILAGRRKVSPAVAKRLSAALHLPLEALL
jgi:HTH-type transcriptional regulator/antitoxin HigA